MMTMFSLFELMDVKKDYQKASMDIVNRRLWSIIESMGLQFSPNPNFDGYYGLIDFEFWARKNIGEEAVEYLKKNIHPLDLAFRLAEDHGIVLLNGGGFEAPNWSLRVSLANLPDEAYEDIGRGVKAVARGYRDAYEASKAEAESSSLAAVADLGASGERAMGLGAVRHCECAREHFSCLRWRSGRSLGRIRIRGFAVGASACILIVAVLLGQLGTFVIPPLLKSLLFGLFVFTIGYRSGPEFFASLSVRTLSAGRSGAGDGRVRACRRSHVCLHASLRCWHGGGGCRRESDPNIHDGYGVRRVEPDSGSPETR